jgi:hypothetical protein
MKVSSFVAVVLACGLAAADPGTRNFDATYKPDMQGGPWLCPEEGHGFTVSHGAFSIPWDIHVGQGNNERALTVAHIDGVLPADGETDATSTAVPRVPAEVAHDARQYHVSLAALTGTTFHVRAHQRGKHGDVEIEMTGDFGQGKCSSEFAEDRDAAPPPDAAASTPELDCTNKPYAVAAWSKDHPYGEGAFAQLTEPGSAPAVYRCAHGCAVGKSPVDNDDTWALVGQCAAPAAPQAEGSPTWDTKYKLGINEASGGIPTGNDWRCPDTQQVPVDLDVSHGKLSMPWNVEVATSGDTAAVLVGRIDAVVHADGTTTVTPVVTVTQLPKQVAAIAREYDRRDVSLDHLRAFRPTLTFFRETDMRKSTYGVGRRAEFRGTDDERCDMGFYAVDFQHQEFKERDGWKATCPDNGRWDSNTSYTNGSQVNVVVGGVRRLYTCHNGSRCDAGVRPDKSGDWERGLPCE